MAAPRPAPLCHVGPALLLALVLSSCGEDDDAAPPIPPDLRIEAVSTSAGDEVAPDESAQVALELSCSPERITLSIGPAKGDYELGDWNLRPRGTCAGDSRCGHLLATVRLEAETLGIVSARRFIELDAQLLGTQEIAVSVELLDDAGEPILDDVGEGVNDEVTLSLSVPDSCTEASAGE